MQKIFNLLALILLVLITSCDSDKSKDKEKQDKTIQAASAEDVMLNNQGVGEMGYFDYNKATDTFEKLVSNNPDWVIGQQNYAIALLNRQKQGDEEQAMAIAVELSKRDNSNLVAHYIAGILNFNQGLCEKALPRFEKIIATDMSDAYALYFAGQCHLQNGQVEKSLTLYQQALSVDNYLRSAYYGSFMAAQRLAKTDLAKQMLESYQKLANNPKARLAEIKYTRMGPKANAIAEPKTSIQTPLRQVKPPFFQPMHSLTLPKAHNFGVVTLNTILGIYVVEEDKMKIYNNKDMAEIEEFEIELSAEAHNLAWGDINNDNKIDVYITGVQDALYLQSDQGFLAVDMKSFGLDQLASQAVRIADADHDGDLDILLLDKQGKFELWNNNLNNTFTALSSQVSLPEIAGYQSIYLEDIDSDRDLDILLVANNSITTLLNDRMWDYQIIDTNFDESIKAVTLADNNIDGKVEMNILTSDSIVTYEFKRRNKQLIKTHQQNNISAQAMLQFDVNGNGINEFLLLDNVGIKIIDSQGEVLEQILLNNVEKFKVLHTINGGELLLLQDQKIKQAQASNARLPFMLLGFTGKEDNANSVRSNYSGIGTNFVIHNQSFYARGNNHHNLSGVDQDFQAVSIAAGSKKAIDFIGINWSDGVYQTELGLEANKQYKIPETQRQLSSCPVIFAWNKGKYEFISDVLGVGGIGFAIGRHQYGEPRPWENYLLTSDQISADNNGVYKLQFTEPMEESAYLDELNIKVIDVPKDYSVLLDERMQISTPAVTGEALFYQDKIMPMRVLNRLNHDVTELVEKTDKQAIEIENQDHRFLGLVDEQVITMEFADELIGDYQLIMNGWVEYGYSQTMFAAWQAGLVAQAPTIEYKVNNKWHTLLSEFGYPAGMPRAASVPLKIPQGTRYLRIKTNMEIYFDELSLIQPQNPENVNSYNLALQSAIIKQLGFPKRQDNKQRVPSYDFEKISPFWDTRYMQGAYSQLGDITPLVNNHDNALAIIAAGEGIELSFIGDLPELQQGLNRYFILQFKGWAKDMDILTKDGETLSPIPSNGHVSLKAQQLNNQFNNRFKAGK